MTIGRPAPLWRDLLLLTLVAAAARAATFGNPILHVDEEFYFAAARMMAEGKLLYVDVWDRKPVGLFLLYLPAAALPLPWGSYAYQALALGFVVATAAVAMRIVALAGWGRGALAAAILYIVWLDLPDGQGGQSPVFYNLPMALAALATMLAADRGRPARRLGLAAMLLIGLAMQIKYSVVFEGIWFGLWLLWRDLRRGTPPGAILLYAAQLVVAALLPTAIVGGFYAAIGHFDAFWFANFRSILARNGDPLAEQWGNLELAAAILGPLIVLALAGIGVAAAESAQATRRRFLRGWLATAVAGFLAFGSWFNHYTLPVILPAAIAAASAVAGRRRGQAAAVAMIVIAGIAGQIVFVSERHIRGTPAEFDHAVAEIGRGPGALYVYSGSAMFYPASGRPALTPYVFSSHLQSAREEGAVGVDQQAEIARILARRPAVVVVQSLDGGELAERHAAILAWLAAHRYRDSRVPIGDKFLDIFKAPGA